MFEESVFTTTKRVRGKSVLTTDNACGMPVEIWTVRLDYRKACRRRLEVR